MADVSSVPDVVVETPVSLSYLNRLSSFGTSFKDTTSEFATSAIQTTRTLADFFTMNPVSYALILGVALTGIAALSTTYDVITGIDDDERACANVDPLKHKLNSKFWVALAVGCIFMLFGLVLTYAFHKKSNKFYTGFVVALLLMGAFTILYALQMQIKHWSSWPRLATMWGLFILFVIAAVAHRAYLNSHPESKAAKKES